MSHFSSVDSSPDPAALVASLDSSARGLAAMKHYVAAAARRAVPGGVVVDVGCGAGHDLELLDAAGLTPIGVDASAVMLVSARQRLARREVPLVRGIGHLLPLRNGGVDGCRVERVLQHVEDPSAVVAELARVVRPGGFLAIFEPDWTSLLIESALPESSTLTAALVRVRHPDIGRRLSTMVEAAGFEVLDEVTEASGCSALVDVPIRIRALVGRATEDGRVDESAAARWLADLDLRDRAGTFRASWNKVLVVAHRREE